MKFVYVIHTPSEPYEPENFFAICGSEVKADAVLAELQADKRYKCYFPLEVRKIPIDSILVTQQPCPTKYDPDWSISQFHWGELIKTESKK